jgi:hypothetical protein
MMEARADYWRVARPYYLGVDDLWVDSDEAITVKPQVNAYHVRDLWARENSIETVKPSPKHRYFYAVGDRRQKREIMGKLSYPVVSAYPKAPRSRYDDGPRVELSALDVLL